MSTSRKTRSIRHEPRVTRRERLDPHRDPALAGDVRGKIVVIKYGGNAMIDEDLKRAFARTSCS
jgi:acetylglutamate kinase